ncbi:MAG: chorismate mutase [Clostridia bacterium]|nr:chorismate mutase [Clostridia bacterium]
MDLDKARQTIDRVDDQIIELFEERMKAAYEVAKYKKENNLPIYNGKREREIVNRLIGKASPELALYVKVLYNTLFSVSREYQTKLINSSGKIVEQIKTALESTDNLFPTSAVVACQGTEGAYSQKACEKLFFNPSVMYFESFKGVFDAVSSGMCRYGILPLENSVHGTVTEVYDLTSSYDFSIVKAVRIQINHVLAARSKDAKIKEIFSHRQAIGQCDKYLKSLKDVTVTPFENTAMAAEMVSKSERDDIAAICSKECAQLYGLHIIDDNIIDSDNNYTRFICISKTPEIYPGADKISFVITLPHTAGSLYSVMSKFAAAGINLTKIESRPIAGRDFEFEFYFEIEASVYSEELYALLSELENSDEKFKFFGCYREV